MDEQLAIDLVRLQADCTIAMITAMSMQAENQARAEAGLAQAYPEKAFLDLIEENGLGHNAVVEKTIKMW